jgi:hypothetical protein
MQYTIGKIFLRVMRYFTCMFPKKIEEDMNVQSFETIKVPILGCPLESLGKNVIWM